MHEWCVSLSSIKYCAGTRRLTLEEAKQIAHSRNGECLSEIFGNLCCENALKGINGIQHLKSLKIVTLGVHFAVYINVKIYVVKLHPIPSENRWSGFLKTSEYPTSLELDISYYHYGFAIEVCCV